MKEIPPQGYKTLSKQVVSYAAGLPLTIKVLGSLLCGKSNLEWVDAIDKLKKIPSKEIQKKLELSYDGLDDEQKEIFLDVATILEDLKPKMVMEALESCGFHAISGLGSLKQKALITIYDENGTDEYVGMHDQLREMAKNIVRRSHRDMSNRHSRLWDDKEIADIFAGDLGTEDTKCILLRTRRLDLEPFMNGLRKMKKLRLLSVSDKFAIYKYPKNNEVRPYFPESLQFLRWNKYPFKYLPKTYQAKNLAGLVMINSKMVQLWEGEEIKVLDNLRFVSLSYGNLRAFDLSLTPNLERLKVVGSGELIEVYMPVECLKLRYLELKGVELTTFDIELAPNLDKLSIEGSDLVDLPMPLRCQNLRSLHLLKSELRTLSVGLTPNLEDLHVENCNNLEKLHIADECVKLRYLYLDGLKLRTLNLGPSPNLKRLVLKKCNNLEKFQIAECPLLTDIHISCSKLRTLDLRLVPNLCKFTLEYCTCLVELQLPSRYLNLKELHLTDSNLRTIVK